MSKPITCDDAIMEIKMSKAEMKYWGGKNKNFIKDMDKDILHSIIKGWIQNEILEIYEVCRTKEEKEMLDYIGHQLNKLKYLQN
jgi:hypothetical protein